MKCLVKMMLEWILGLLVEISKELDEWELFRLKGFNQSTKSRIACYHDKNIKQLKRLLENKDVIGFYITIKEMEFVFRLSNRVGNYCITNK